MGRCAGRNTGSVFAHEFQRVSNYRRTDFQLFNRRFTVSDRERTPEAERHKPTLSGPLESPLPGSPREPWRPSVPLEATPSGPAVIGGEQPCLFRRTAEIHRRAHRPGLSQAAKQTQNQLMCIVHLGLREAPARTRPPSRLRKSNRLGPKVGAKTGRIVIRQFACRMKDFDL